MIAGFPERSPDPMWQVSSETGTVTAIDQYLLLQFRPPNYPLSFRIQAPASTVTSNSLGPLYWRKMSLLWCSLFSALRLALSPPTQ
jgi:hypothetical protein